AGEGGKDQVASVRVTGMHGQLVAVLGGATHFVDVREVQFRVYALGVQVQGQGHQADVAGALAATEQAAFDTVCASHHSQFSSRYRSATVVVRVYAQGYVAALFQIVVHPLDLVGVHVGRGGLNGRGQVQDDALVGGRCPGFNHRVTHVQRKFRLGGAEYFGRILVAPLGLRVLGHFVLDQACTGQGNFLDLVLAQVKDNLAKGRCTCVVQVNDGALGTGSSFGRALDQVFTRLCQDDDGDVFRNAVFVDQLTNEIEVGLRCGRETDLDFLETDFDELLEKAQFASHVHGLDQGLVAVTQVCAHPDGRFGNALGRPGAFSEVA